MTRRLAFGMAVALGWAGSLAGAAALPFPQHVEYAPGSLLPTLRSRAQLDQDVLTAYTAWQTNYLAQAGTEADGHPRYRVKTSTSATAATVSEGQGYGMLLTAYLAGADLNAQTIFDGLWEYCNDHRSTIDPRLMDWHVPANEHAEPGDDDSAFDGDCDIAFALLLADRQWDSAGRINYSNQAAQVLAGMLASAIGPDSHLPMLGDWVATNGTTFNQFTTRPSDFMPDHFRAFARATGNAAWSAVLAAVQAAVAGLQVNFSPGTGLIPDFAVPVSVTNHALKPAPAHFLEGANDGNYSYNAGRVPWRIGTDALLNNDALSATQAYTIAAWAAAATGGDPRQLHAGYQLNGIPLAGSDYYSTFFVAPLGVGAMVSSNLPAWLNAVYRNVYRDSSGYYEDSVALLCLLVMSGNYWDPTTAVPEPAAGMAVLLAAAGVAVARRSQFEKAHRLF